MNLEAESILILDSGLFLSFAQRMAALGGFGKVFYCNLERRGRPSFHELKVGEGYPGIEILRTPYDKVDGEPAIENASVIAFPDCFDGEWQMHLRSQGKAVWGSGLGSELELYRLYAKKIMAAVGLDIGPYVVIKGITKLREHLKANEDRVIKVSYVRGLMETRKHQKYWLSKTFLDGLEYRLGPTADDQEFIVEETIDTKLEIGGDQIFCGRFPDTAINGVEIKDSCYLGVVQDYADLPEDLRAVNDALAPVLKRAGYFNFFSTEGRKAQDDTFYPIDLTCRQGSPSGEAQLAIWKNLPEVVFAGAHGEFLNPEPTAAYVAQAMIYNQGDEREWCPIDIPKRYQDKINLYYGLRKGDEHYAVPQRDGFEEVGSVTDIGSTPDEAIDKVKAIAESLGGNISCKVECFDDALKEFDLMEKKGMSVEPVAA